MKLSREPMISEMVVIKGYGTQDGRSFRGRVVRLTKTCAVVSTIHGWSVLGHYRLVDGIERGCTADYSGFRMILADMDPE